MKTELLSLMKNRRSIRKYRKDPVPSDKIYKTLEAGRYAPSGNNRQPWIYIVVTDNKLKEEIRKKLKRLIENFTKKLLTNSKNGLKNSK